MKRKKKSPIKKNSGRKLLNIIYFVDAQKTKSIKIPILWFRALIVAGISILIWLGAATYSVIEVYKDRQALAEQLETALATVFDYQTKYEGVYEEAYPGNQNKAASDVVVADEGVSKSQGAKGTSLNNQNAQTTKVLTSDPVKSLEESKKVDKGNKKQALTQNERTESSVNLTASSKSLTSAQIKKLPVAIEQPIFVRTDKDSFTLRFDIKNTKSPQRTEGYVWAVAKLLLNDKTVVSLGAPKGIKLDKDDLPSNPTSLNRYSIRYYKRKTLKFQNIKTNVDRIQNVVIGILNSSGETVSYHLNVDAIWKSDSRPDNEMSYNKEELPLKVTRVASLNLKGEAM